MRAIDRFVQRLRDLWPAPSSRIRAAILLVLAGGPLPTLRILERVVSDHRIAVGYVRCVGLLHELEYEGAIRSFNDYTDVDIRGGRPRRMYCLEDGKGTREEDDEREAFLSARAVRA